MNWGVNEVVDCHIVEIQKKIRRNKLFFCSSFSLALRVGTLFLHHNFAHQLLFIHFAQHVR